MQEAAVHVICTLITSFPFSIQRHYDSVSFSFLCSRFFTFLICYICNLIFYIGQLRSIIKEYIKPPIFTLCVGNAWGEAALLLAAGAKGNPSALPSSTIMIRHV